MAHDLVTELLQYSSLACFMPIWQLCANLLIPNCLRSNLSYSPLTALEPYVKKPKTINYLRQAETWLKDEVSKNSWNYELKQRLSCVKAILDENKSIH